MHSKSDNIEIMNNDKADKIIDKLFQSLFSRYKIRFVTAMRGSNFMCDCVDLSYYKCYKISFKRGGSYIESPDWIKNQKSNDKLHN